MLLALSTPAFSSIACTNGSSDANTIQSAVNKGGTVTLSGTCSLGSTAISINNAVTINGTAQINSTGSIAMVVSVDNVTISGLTFNGAGVHLNEIPQQSGFTFTNNTIENTNGNDGMVIDGILRSSLIDSNTFFNIAPSSFISATYSSIGFPACWRNNSCQVNGVALSIFGGLDQTSITNNSFDLIGNDAVHVGWNLIGGPSLYFLTKNNTISYNKLSRVHRIGLEIQAIWSWPYCGINGSETCAANNNFSTNSQIKGNYYHDPFLPYNDTFAYSLALWGDGQYINNAGIENNTASCEGFVGYGIEDMGNNVLTQGNVIASDYLSCGSQRGFYPIVYGSQITGTQFTTQNNVMCGDQSTNVPPSPYTGEENGYSNLATEPNSSGTKVDQDNYLNNTCPNTAHLTTSSITPAFLSSSTSGANQTWNISVVSTLPVKWVQFFVDGSATPVATQELQDHSTTFSADQKWLYHTTLNTSVYSSASHTITAKATDVAGSSTSISQSFSGESTAGVPVAQLSPTSLSFLSQAVHAVSAPQVFSLTNTGTASLSVSNLGISGAQAADFTVSSGCLGSLLPNASCSITTIFTPSIAGVESALLTITDNAATSTLTAALSGTGVVTANLNLPALPYGLMLWLTNDAGVITNGTSVTSWQDQSGYGNNALQTVAANQPTLVAGNNNNHAVRFNGQSSFMSVPSLPISGLTGMTVFLVSSDSQDKPYAGYGTYSFLNWPENTGWGTTFFATYQTGSHFRFGTTQIGNENYYSLPFTRTNSFGLSEWMHSATVDSMWFNTQSVASYTGKLQPLAGSGAQLNLGVGNGNTFYPGDVSEVIIFKRALTTAERQTVEQYLMNKYHL